MYVREADDNLVTQPSQSSDSTLALRVGLNREQERAVLHPGGPLLVLAGAGSGKTRVLTHRIAYLVAAGLASPSEVLAIAFTNKAADEMRERVVDLVGRSAGRMWVSTFHSACARILRQEAEQLGYRPNFSIYDQDDQVRLVRRCLQELEFDPKRFPPRGVHARISAAKNRLVDPDEFIAAGERPGGWEDRAAGPGSPYLEVVGDVYRLYQRRLYELNAMDFDDLLARTVDVFELFPRRLEHYRSAFGQILVDEYQDTNHAQYTLIKMLAQEHRQIMVVGDDDQSVYSWRGADIRNILEFEEDFPDTAVVKLERNYRSTPTILGAANAVVSQNRGRKPKRLWTEKGEGDRVVLCECRNEHEEARAVVNEIQGLIAGGTDPGGIAVFYRVNAQSRVLEDLLVRFGVDYQVVGGTKFYERAEVRDVLAYLRALVNPADDVSMGRIINTPKRGVGSVARGHLQQAAEQEGTSMREVLCRVEEVEALAPSARRSLEELGRAFARWGEEAAAARAAEGGVAQLVERVLEDSGLVTTLQEERTLEAEGRLENLEEFVGVAREYDKRSPEGSLEEFLQEISLYADIDSLDEAVSRVTLTTLHNAKGLEFPTVFLVGLEEGLLPHVRSLDEQNVEEERRLCYVGITRAMDRLYLSYSRERTLRGMLAENEPSRFLEDLPEAVVEYRGSRSSTVTGRGRSVRDAWGIRCAGGSARLDGSGRAAATAGQKSAVGRSETPGPAADRARGDEVGFSVGDKVIHAKFGEGVVLGTEGAGAVRIFFSDLGEQKKLLVEYAPLRRIS